MNIDSPRPLQRIIDATSPRKGKISGKKYINPSPPGKVAEQSEVGCGDWIEKTEVFPMFQLELRGLNML